MNTFSSPQYIVVHYLRYQLKNKAKAGDAQIHGPTDSHCPGSHQAPFISVPPSLPLSVAGEAPYQVIQQPICSYLLPGNLFPPNQPPRSTNHGH